MVYQFRKLHFACLVAATATALVVASMAQPVAAGSVKDLAGRWSGWGSVKLSNGATEQVKCVATYFVKNAGALITAIDPAAAR